MKTREFDELYRLEETYWWFIGRRELVRQLVREETPPGALILDAGCGTGGTMAILNDSTSVIGCDRSPYALQMCTLRHCGSLLSAEVQALPFVDEAFDVVISCDVLEHVPRDDLTVREMLRILRPGGRLILTVPAHSFLWSEHDEALSHLRRYSAKQLRTLLEESGAQVTKLSPVVTIALAPILVFRLLQRLRPKSADSPKTDLRILPPWLNSLLVAFLRFENFLLRRINLPVGTSLVAVATRKP